MGDRAENLRDAAEALPEAGIKVVRVSPVYETEPLEFTQQAWFLNLVVEAETALFPAQLLARTARIEREHGRVRGVPKVPARSISIFCFMAARWCSRQSCRFPIRACRSAVSYCSRWQTWLRIYAIRSRTKQSANYCTKPRRNRCGASR